jgi:hypothetical protein
VKKFRLKILALCFLILAQNLFLISCGDSPIELGIYKDALYQVAGCNKQLLKKSLTQETCFDYDFSKNLIVDFCVSGNCCPDKDRYKLASTVFQDTINITVRDTAKNLCKCNCNYVIHAEFTNLSRDSFIVKCVQEGDTFKNILYIEKVSKK